MARRHRSFTRPAARTMMWIGAGIVEQNVATSGGTLLGTLSAGALGLRPFTVIRSHVWVHIKSDQAAVSEFVQGVFSSQVVTDSAAAAGIASVPTGITEPEADYFVYQPIF